MINKLSLIALEAPATDLGLRACRLSLPGMEHSDRPRRYGSSGSELEGPMA